VNPLYDPPSFDALYRAKVVDNNDPEKSGRVCVVIPALSNERVWARPAFLGYSPECGCWLVPAVGCYVYVFFENGDPSLPVYLTGVVLLHQVLHEAKVDKPQNEFVIWRSPKGYHIKVSDNQDYIYLECGEYQAKIDRGNRKIFLRTPSLSITMDEDGRVIDAVGNVQISGNVSISGELSVSGTIHGPYFTGTAANAECC